MHALPLASLFSNSPQFDEKFFWCGQVARLHLIMEKSWAWKFDTSKFLIIIIIKLDNISELQFLHLSHGLNNSYLIVSREN